MEKTPRNGWMAGEKRERREREEIGWREKKRDIKWGRDMRQRERKYEKIKRGEGETETEIGGEREREL